MKNPLLEMADKRGRGQPVGAPSFCTSNELVIEALLEQAKPGGGPVLVEGTANQINQFGGYTGMTPADFRAYVQGVASRVGFDKANLILGGDHMGPLVWANLPEAEAMENARQLVRQCVLAGFKKIHLDTSMRLGGDPRDEKLSNAVIAGRGAALLEACEAAYQELLRENPAETRPVYVIGSEVPIPGGTQEETGLQVTSVRDLEDTLSAYREAFEARGLLERWEDIVAVVVQPGVEFGEHDVHAYDREKAAELCRALKRHPNIVFEGHSTDYQPPDRLREMVEDGVAILKVGPALTFALREGLFALSRMEEELLPPEARANFPRVLDSAMLANPKYWEKYYHGSERDIRLAREYSYSDRCRYYFAVPEVRAAMEKLFANMDSAGIPMGMLSQYMPRQYKKVRAGALPLRARELVKDCVAAVGEVYHAACHV